MNKIVKVGLADLVTGQEVTVWYGDGYGQGGTVISLQPLMIRVPLGEVMKFPTWTSLEIEVPYDNEECVNYDEEHCQGEVEAVGIDIPHPRCEFHAEKYFDAWERARAYDAPSPPSWFDSALAGERWSDDY